MNDVNDNSKIILTSSEICILQQILASSTGALSQPELCVRNTLSENSIRNHLDNLRNQDPPLVTILRTESPTPAGIPEEYFAVTDSGIQYLKHIDAYDQIGILYDMYDAADIQFTNPKSQSATIEEIEDYSDRPEPEWLH